MTNSLAMSVRVVSVALLLNCLLFFQGCDKNNKRLQCSLGIAVPFAKVEVANEVGMGRLPSRLYDLSPVLVLINAAIGLVLGIGFVQLPATKRAWASLMIACGITNIFVVSMWAWMYAVFMPVCWIVNAWIWVSTLGRPKQVAENEIAVVAASRIWLALAFTLVYVSLAGIARLRSLRVKLRARGA